MAAGYATFSPFVYNREKTAGTLRHLSANGFNVVRVFINGFWGKRGTRLEKADAAGLSPAYLDHLVDFLLQARQHGILVIPRRVANFPGTWNSGVESLCFHGPITPVQRLEMGV